MEAANVVVAHALEEPGRGPSIVGRDFEDDARPEGPDQEVGDLRFDVVELGPEAALIVCRQAGGAQGLADPTVGGEALEPRVAAFGIPPLLGGACRPQSGGMLPIETADQIEGELRQPTKMGSSTDSFFLVALAGCL